MKTKTVSWSDLKPWSFLYSGSQIVSNEALTDGWYRTTIDRPNSRGTVTIERKGSDLVDIRIPTDLL